MVRNKSRKTIIKRVCMEVTPLRENVLSEKSRLAFSRYFISESMLIKSLYEESVRHGIENLKLTLYHFDGLLPHWHRSLIRKVRTYKILIGMGLSEHDLFRYTCDSWVKTVNYLKEKKEMFPKKALEIVKMFENKEWL